MRLLIFDRARCAMPWLLTLSLFLALGLSAAAARPAEERHLAIAVLDFEPESKDLGKTARQVTVLCGRGVSLFAGASAFREHERFPLPEDEAIVLFTERESEPPRLFIERTDRGTTVSVEMRLLNRLATDPLAQKIFLEVFQLLHEERPSVKGDIQ